MSKTTTTETTIYADQDFQVNYGRRIALNEAELEMWRELNAHKGDGHSTLHEFAKRVSARIEALRGQA